jgi:hypothetical protein
MFIVDKDITRKIIIFLQMWSKKASISIGAGKSHLNEQVMSTKVFLQTILKNVTGLELSYFQFSKYYENVPEIKNKIAKLNQSIIKVNLPGEEDNIEIPDVDLSMPEPPSSEVDTIIPEPDTTSAATIPDVEPTIEPPQGPSGPNYKSIVANMAKRARQRNSK